ncbi:MAG: Na/Pi cotransporter family protein [Bacteroidia bacterium]|nr:Na/Pi cotransporter family protein [Bacteroidia bacterium]
MQFGFFEIITLLGSLGLFLFGMQLMSNSLMTLAGDKMRTFLATMTSNRFLAVFTGFLVTTVIQSSSATTLMVVSFVNASLLTLTESIGVIMGANIGTTVTAWLITILGFKVSMSAIALPLVGLGFLLGFSKNSRTKHWGSFTIGFAVLFIGLQFLKEGVPDIKQNPEVLEWLKAYTDLGYWSVLIFLAVGTILTVVIQSSSATMALTLVMCYEGWIPFDMAAAMVLGENIGTTITANLASMVANYNAKRTARAHVIFNLFGVVWMLILFYPFINGVEWFVTRNGSASPFLQAAAVPVALSVFHTAFNIINTFVMIWFIPFIEKIVVKLVSKPPEKVIELGQPKYLNDSALDYPVTAIKALRDESKRVFEGPVFEIMAHAINVHRGDVKSEFKSKAVVKGANKIIEVNINEVYYNKVKYMYGLILEFATKISVLFSLSKNVSNEVNQIRLANRHVVLAIKGAEELQGNIDKYMLTDNKNIKKQYNRLRKKMVQVLRANYVNQIDDGIQAYLTKFSVLRNKITENDVLIDGTLDHLIRDGLITSEMALSLANDNRNIAEICVHLMDAVELLYIQNDPVYKELPENEVEAPVLEEQ